MVVERQLSGYRTWQILHLGNVLALFSKSGNECNWDSNPKIWVKFQNWKKMNVHVINWSEKKTKMIETRCVMWVMILVQAVHRIIIIVISILVENLAWVLLLLLLPFALGQIRKKFNVKKHSEMQWESITQPYANCVFSPFLPCSSQLSILSMFNQPWNINK